jgi:hypothetical protein
MKIAALLVAAALALGASAGFAQDAEPASAAPAAAPAGSTAGDPYEAVAIYLDTADEDRQLAQALASGGGLKDGDTTFTRLHKAEFKRAYEAARDQTDLADAIKAVRAAHTAMFTRYSLSADSELNKAIGSARVELDLVR